MAKAKYEEWLTHEGLLRLGAWAGNGLTEEQIASNIGISRQTLSEWKKKYPDISRVLKRGMDIADIEVENALHKKAVGYKTVEKKTVKKPNGTEVTITEKEVAPDTTAAIFWLKNRRTDKWRDKRESGNEEPIGADDGFIEAMKGEKVWED